MKKLFFFFTVFWLSLTMQAAIVVTLVDSSFTKIKQPANAAEAVGEQKVEYNVTNTTADDSILIGYNYVYNTSSSTGTAYSGYFMFYGKNGTPFIFSKDTIKGYYIRKVELEASSGTGEKASLDVAFGKDTIDSLSISDKKMKFVKSKTYTFWNEEHANVFWNVSVDRHEYGTNSGTNNGQISKITITYLKADGSEDDAYPIPEPEPEPVYDTITVSDAVDSINNHKGDKNWVTNVFVVGKVCEDPTFNSSYGDATFWMVDTANNNDSIQAYKILKKDGTKFTQVTLNTTIHKGDIVQIFANKLEYFTPTTGASKNEINGGKFDSTLYTTPIQYDTISVKDALDSINKHKEDKNWTKNVFVRGFVTGVPSLYEGKANFYLIDDPKATDRIQAWNIVKKDDSNFASQEELDTTINIGDEVLIRGIQLEYYVNKDDTAVKKNEINGGQLEKTLSTSSSFVQKLSLDSGKVIFDEVDDKAVFHMYSPAFMVNPKSDNYLTFSIENDLENDIRAIAHNYEKEDICIVMATNEKNDTVCVPFAQMLITYLSSDSNRHNTYEVRFSTFNEKIGFFICIDTIKILGKIKDGEEVLFGVDNGDAIRHLTVARAMQEAEKLASGATSKEVIYVYGYHIKNVKNGDFADGSQSFFISDNKDDANGPLEIYKGKADSAIEKGDFVRVKGKLQNYNGTQIEISYGEVVVLDPADAPELEQEEIIHYDTISVRKAYQLGEALPNPDSAQTNYSDTYVIVGYCTKVKEAYSTQFKNESWYMDNTEDGDTSLIQVFRGVPDSDVKVGDLMLVTGKISKYCGASTKEESKGELYYNIQIALGAKAIHAPAGTKVPNDVDQSAIFNNISSSQNNNTVIKKIENGKIVIIRNGEKYDILGTKQ